MKFSSDNLNSLRETSQPEEKGSYTYEYPRPAVTADAVIFGFDNHELHVLLIERGVAPFRGMWALPGGFMRMNETIDQCVRRELREETGAVAEHYIDLGKFYPTPGYCGEIIHMYAAKGLSFTSLDLDDDEFWRPKRYRSKRRSRWS